MAINKEIIAEQSSCPSCGGKELEENTAIEVGNIFKLKTKYSDPFDLAYKDQGGKEQAVLMGCYGIGISRLMGALVEIFHDENGIIWPESVAPAKAHLLSLGGVSADEIYADLQNKGIEVVYDDRETGAGEKFKDADLMGIPWRLVVSPGTKGKIEIKKRSEKGTKIVDREEAIRTLLA